MMPDELVLVLTNWPDVDQARRAARTLVVERLVACANILPGLESVYHWKGEVETAAEVMVLMKTARSRYSALEARVKELHPYEVPEILAFSAVNGLGGYLAWVAESMESAEQPADAQKKR